MLLKELTMTDFRQYMGEQKVVFSTDPEKNVTLLLGKNTSGKTTFVQAFRWILYDNSDFVGSGKNSKMILNDNVRRSMRAGDERLVKASLRLEHQGREYLITRELKYISKISGDASAPYGSILRIQSEVGDGEWRQVSMNVDSILPNDLAEYFFFDGEKIASSTNKSNVEQSINTIMGLTPLKAMIDHINPQSSSSVYSKFESRRVDDPSGNIAPLKRKLEIAKKSLESCEDREKIETTRLEIRDNAYKEALKAFSDIENIAKRKEELDATNKKIETKEKQLEVATQDLLKSFTPMMMEYYTNHLANQLLPLLQEYNVIDKGIPDITANTIKFLLERGKCACGCDLTANEEYKQALEELLSYVPPESIGSQIGQLNKDLGYFVSSNDKARFFSGRNKDYNEINADLEELATTKSKLLHEIGNQGSDAEKIKENYVRCESELKETRDELTRIGSQKLHWSKEIKTNQDQIDEFSKYSGVNEELDKELMYVRALYKKALYEYESGSKEILQKMREVLQEVFKKMYHGNRDITLSDDYKISLTAEGSTLDASKGLETVKNFAFITTLLKVASERVKENTELSAEPYPLVMDAVFSNTDEKHIRNICDELPAMAEQAILAIMDKDWNVAKSSLVDNVGKAYRINKISESETHIEEVML